MPPAPHHARLINCVMQSTLEDAMFKLHTSGLVVSVCKANGVIADDKCVPTTSDYANVILDQWQAEIPHVQTNV